MAPTKKPTVKVDHIKARFGGRDLVFKIPRDQLEMFERAIACPAQVRFRRIAADEARFDEVLEVLELSAPQGLGKKIPDGEAAVIWYQARRNGVGIGYRGPIDGTSSFVAQTLAANAPAKYSLLAQAVIAACLYGVPEDAAVFNEDEIDIHDEDADAES